MIVEDYLRGKCSENYCMNNEHSQHLRIVKTFQISHRFRNTSLLGINFQLYKVGSVAFTSSGMFQNEPLGTVKSTISPLIGP